MRGVQGVIIRNRAVDFRARRASGSNFTAYKLFIAHCQRLLLNPYDL